MNIKQEARKIIQQHTEAMILSMQYEPKTNTELYELMVDNCAFILTNLFLDGEYTPMEYNAIRNELVDMLWNAFDKAITQESYDYIRDSLGID